MRSFILLIFLQLTLFSFGQNNLTDQNNVDSLRRKCATYCNVPTELELPMLMALIHYPELKGTTIKFKERRISTTLNARPTVLSLLFRSKSKRVYTVRINKTKKDSIISIYEVPYSAQIGVFAHEFSHFSDYSYKSFWGVLSRGMSYMNKSKKQAFEKEIDLLTIYHGLGNELYQWSDFVLNKSNASDDYKTFKRMNYLTPEEINRYLQILSY